MRRTLYLLIPILALLCSCEDTTDDYRYPSVFTDYACFVTNNAGKIEQMRLDNGCTYPILFSDEYLEAHDREPIYKADTLYRVISVYELDAAADDTTAYIYSIHSVISTVPTPLSANEKLHCDPVYLQSIWRSGGYLNMVIEIKALDGKHSVGYVDTTPEGMHGKEFTFYHQVISDVESYRQRLYGSIPLAPFNNVLQQGDTLRFVINTYDEGFKKVEYLL